VPQQSSVLTVPLASLPVPIVALISAVLGGLVAAALMALWTRRRPAAAAKPAVDPRLENYQLILDTLDRSNVLLWWAGSSSAGVVRMEDQDAAAAPRENPIYRLAALVDKHWLWKDEQSPDHERTSRPR
jgi:hypothetical protein